MQVSRVIAQLRTTNLSESIRFYTEKLGFTLEFQYEEFYAGIRSGDQILHLKWVEEQDPTLDYVAHGGHFHLYFQTSDIATVAESLRQSGVNVVEDLHETAWSTREIVIKDNQGHTLYFGEPQ